jgi:hypothetical protein
MTFCIYCKKNIKNIKKHLNDKHNSLEIVMFEGVIESVKYNGEEMECIESESDTIITFLNSFPIKRNLYVLPYEKILISYGNNYFIADHLRDEYPHIEDINIINK